MSGSLVRCMIVDLEKKEVSFLTWARNLLSDGLGTYGIYAAELRSVWQEDPDAIALATGPLTGTAVPGAGGMSWCKKGQNGFRLEHTEGRLGAALRCVPADHLVMKGTCSEPTDLVIGERGVTFRPVTEGGEEDLWPRLFRERPDPDSVVALMDRDGIREDNCFLIGSRELSGQMRGKGIRAVTVTGLGSVEVEQPQEMLRQSMLLVSEYRKSGRMTGGRKQPARYLSVNHIWTDASDSPAGLDSLSMPLAFLGLGWDEEFPGGDSLEAGVRLLNACTGLNWDKEKLRECNMQIERGMRNYGGEPL